MRKVAKFIWKEFIYGGHLQCLGIVGITYISGFLLNLRTSWEILVSVYLIFYSIYINDRLRHIKLDELTNPERVKHFKSYFFLIPKIILFAISCLLAILFYIDKLNFTIFSLLLLFFGLAYPIYFKNLTKKLIAFKNFYVGTLFTAATLAPIIYYFYAPDYSVLFSLVFFMILVFIKSILMQILLDIKDIESDKSLHLLTAPILIGEERTFTFLKISNSLTTLSLLLTGFILRLFPGQMLILLFAIPFNFYSYKLAENQNYYGYVLGSGEFALWLILILFAKMI